LKNEQTKTSQVRKFGEHNLSYLRNQVVLLPKAQIFLSKTKIKIKNKKIAGI